MSNLALLVALCLLPLNVSASSKEDSIRAYYNNVLQAESYCIHKDYKAAIPFYNKAFEYKTPFATDVYNLMLCGLDLKYNALVLDCAERLVKKGAPLAFFEQSLFNRFKSSKEYQQLQSKYEQWHRGYLAQANQQLIEYIRKLVGLDQNVHCMLPVRAEDKAFVDSMHNNDDSLAVILIDLLQNNEYLDEDIVGVVFEDDTILKQQPLYGIIALHQVQRGGKILTDAIYDAMKKGHLRSEIGLGWLSQTMVTKLDLTRQYMVYDDTLWKLKETQQEALIFQKLSGQTDEMRLAILHEVYLDNGHLNVEERIVYNFSSYCEECPPEVDRPFFILPRAIITESIAEGHEEEWVRMTHLLYDVLAHK